MPPLTIAIGLLIILLCVLFLPFLFKKIEQNLEAFLFIIGIISVTVSGLWSPDIIKNAIISPVAPKHPIVEAVLVAGFLFTFLTEKIDRFAKRMEEILSLRVFVFLLVLALGLLSSVITAIIASLLLVEIINVLKLDKKTEIKIVVFSCYSIGFGAALTPIGEPLSTILVERLKGEPYNAGFFFLIRNISLLIIPAILLSSAVAAYFSKRKVESADSLREDRRETPKDILVRAGKVYLFIMGLEFLARGFSPAVDYIVPKVMPQVLYWINTISAILDNATLTAAEATPRMSILQVKSMLMGLLISGGMLIPGNIPNIISACKLRITSREWAKAAVPFGIIMLVAYYIILFVI